jgi:hypothetical protein
VVPGSQAAQDAPAEEQQQQEDHDIDNEDKDDKGYSPLSDNKGEKLYRDADERESFSAAAPIPTGRLRALLGHLGITSTPRNRIKGVPRLGQVELMAVVEIFSDTASSTGTKGQPSEHLSVMLWLMPPGRPSLLEAVATRVKYRTLSTASYLSERMTHSRPLGEEGCP